MESKVIPELIKAPSEPGDYEAPKLRQFGDIRALTLGNSVDVGDSGGATLQRF